MHVEVTTTSGITIQCHRCRRRMTASELPGSSQLWYRCDCGVRSPLGHVKPNHCELEMCFVALTVQGHQVYKCVKCGFRIEFPPKNHNLPLEAQGIPLGTVAGGASTREACPKEQYDDKDTDDTNVTNVKKDTIDLKGRCPKEPSCSKSIVTKMSQGAASPPLSVNESSHEKTEPIQIDSKKLLHSKSDDKSRLRSLGQALSKHVKLALPKPGSSIDDVDFHKLARRFLTAYGEERPSAAGLNNPERQTPEFASRSHEFIRDWYAVADLKDGFQDVERAFQQALSLTKFGNNQGEFLMSMFEQANRGTPPKIVVEKWPDEPEMWRLASLCRELQRHAGEEPFLLAQRTACEFFAWNPENTRKKASARLWHLQDAGIIEKIQVGTVKLNIAEPTKSKAQATKWKYLLPTDD